MTLNGRMYALFLLILANSLQTQAFSGNWTSELQNSCKNKCAYTSSNFPKTVTPDDMQACKAGCITVNQCFKKYITEDIEKSEILQYCSTACTQTCAELYGLDFLLKPACEAGCKVQLQQQDNDVITAVGEDYLSEMNEILDDYVETRNFSVGGGPLGIEEVLSSNISLNLGGNFQTDVKSNTLMSPEIKKDEVSTKGQSKKKDQNISFAFQGVIDNGSLAQQTLTRQGKVGPVTLEKKSREGVENISLDISGLVKRNGSYIDIASKYDPISTEGIVEAVGSAGATEKETEKIEIIEKPRKLKGKGEDKVEAIKEMIHARAMKKGKSAPVLEKRKKKIVSSTVPEKGKKKIESVPPSEKEKKKIESVPPSEKGKKKIESVPASEKGKKKIESASIRKKEKKEIESAPASEKEKRKIKSAQAPRKAIKISQAPKKEKKRREIPILAKTGEEKGKDFRAQKKGGEKVKSASVPKREKKKVSPATKKEEKKGPATTLKKSVAVKEKARHARPITKGKEKEKEEEKEKKEETRKKDEREKGKEEEKKEESGKKAFQTQNKSIA